MTVELNCARCDGGRTETIILDVAMLRDQRDWLLAMTATPEADGIVNLLDTLLDVAEGFPLAASGRLRRLMDDH